MSDLNGKVALVTGAAGMRGMGRAIALKLAGRGASVVVVDHPEANKTFAPESVEAGWRGLDSVVGEVRELGAQAMAIHTDVTMSADVEDMAKAAVEAFGSIDIVVNNAAIAGPVYMPVVEMDDATWHRLMGVNLHGAFHVCRAAARGMVARGRGGRIVMIASWTAKTGLAGMSAYCASKAGMLSLTQTLALELAQHKINVNAICPGGFPTDINYPRIASLAAEQGISIDEARLRHIASFGQKSPLGRVGDVREIADAVAFLSSDEAAYITGQSLNVDGGALMAR
jgi:NAD(P)-dependent dehydrogenase (short-subunit alcohol dehydrogenase family)